MKRNLAALLVFCFVCSLLPTMAFAAEPEPNPAAGLETGFAEIVVADAGEDGIMPLTTIDDHTPPVVDGVFMSNPGGTVTVEDTLYFSVSAEDESGISSMGAALGFTYICEQQHRHIEYAYRAQDFYDEEAKQAKFELEITSNMLNGTYKLSSVSLYDVYNNSAYYTPDKPGNIDFDTICFTITGSSAVEDHTPPIVTSISMEESEKVVTSGDTLHFSVSVEDESEISSMGAALGFTYICEQQHRHIEYAYRAQDFYDEEAKQAKFELEITSNMLNGTYKLSSVSLYDVYNNSAYYTPDKPGDIDFDTICFTIAGSSAVEDHTPPIVTSISMEESEKVVTSGDTLHFSVSVEDESEISSMGAALGFTYICEQQHRHIEYAYRAQDFYDEEAKQAKFELEITSNMLNGTYKLSSVSLYDVYNNSAYYTPDKPGDIDFDAIYFTIATPDIEPTEVSIPETLSLSVRTTETIYPDVAPAESIPDWTWESADTDIATAAKVENGKALLITGIAPGTTTITGTTQNDLEVTCTVTVTDTPEPTGGTINETYSVGVGGTVDIEPVLTPSDATTLYEVTSDNPHVASIGLTNGSAGVRIQGVNPGTATITIRGVGNNLKMTTTVRVGRETDTPHEKRTIEGWPATCIRAGRTDSVRCSVCWYVFTEAQEIPATGKHTWSEWQVVREATSTTAGLKERHCEVCWERETETIPATGSNPGGSGGVIGPGSSGGSDSSGSGGSSSSGGGSGSSGGSSSSSDSSSSSSSSGSSSNSTSSGGVTSDGQSVQATVKGGTAEISNSDKNISGILDGAENGAVHIDASANNGVTEVSIPKGVMDAISESETVSTVSITTSAGTVELHEEALNTLSTAMTGDNDTVSLEVKTIDVNTIPSTQKYPIADVLNSAVFINLSASVQHKDANGRTTSTEAIHEFGGSVTVSVPFEMPANMEGRQIIACHIADDGTITYFPVKYENGVATFTTTHFSIFALVESRAAAFSDIDISAWYMLAVEYALNSDLMNGYSNGLFAPDKNLSRAMLTQILYNKEGNPAVSSGSTFADVSANDWCSNAVTWAAENGIVGGYGNGLFGPDNNITREQLAVMLWRYAGSPAATNQELRFTDADKASGYALDALRWASENGVLNGYSDGRLNPGGLATRAQVAQMLKNYLEK